MSSPTSNSSQTSAVPAASANRLLRSELVLPYHPSVTNISTRMQASISPASLDSSTACVVLPTATEIIPSSPVQRPAEPITSTSRFNMSAREQLTVKKVEPYATESDRDLLVMQMTTTANLVRRLVEPPSSDHLFGQLIGSELARIPEGREKDQLKLNIHRDIINLRRQLHARHNSASNSSVVTESVFKPIVEDS